MRAQDCHRIHDHLFLHVHSARDRDLCRRIHSVPSVPLPSAAVLELLRSRMQLRLVLLKQEARILPDHADTGEFAERARPVHGHRHDLEERERDRQLHPVVPVSAGSVCVLNLQTSVPFGALLEGFYSVPADLQLRHSHPRSCGLQLGEGQLQRILHSVLLEPEEHDIRRDFRSGPRKREPDILQRDKQPAPGAQQLHNTAVRLLDSELHQQHGLCVRQRRRCQRPI